MRRNQWLRSLAGILMVALLMVAALRLSSPEPVNVHARLDASALVGGTDTAGFRRAIEPREFSFPRDHGPHDGFRTEWWYFTGNLQDATGRHFGYQLTFFRRALHAGPVTGESPWSASHAFMAHFALTDAKDQRFFAYERFAREALGLAGARPEPLAIWVEDWRVDAGPDGSFRLNARADSVSLTRILHPTRRPTLQGNEGLSQKSSDSGNASYYYSLTRLETRGSLNVSGRPYVVHGSSWMDREWSTSALAGDQVGWDWLALQLDDGRDLMFYRLRLRGGGIAPQSAGSIVYPDGRILTLRSDDVRWDVLDSWTSAMGVRYPSHWRVRVPAAALDLDVTPLLQDQELDLAVRYWEGAVVARGTARGRGYLELTGYDTARGAARAAPELTPRDSTT